MLNNIEIEKLKKKALSLQKRTENTYEEFLITPASETTVGRLFAYLGTVYNKTTCNMEPDTANAQLECIEF